MSTQERIDVMMKGLPNNYNSDKIRDFGENRPRTYSTKPNSVARRLRRAKARLKEQTEQTEPGYIKEIQSLRKLQLNVKSLLSDTYKPRQQSRIFAPLVKKLTRGIDQSWKMLEMDKKGIKSARKNGERRLAPLIAETRIKTKGSYMKAAEKELIRQWIRQENGQISNTDTYRYCESSFRKDIFKDYQTVGCIIVNISLIQSPNYARLLSNPNSRGLSQGDQSLVTTWYWAQQGFPSPRPEGILSRNRMNFFRAVDEIKPGTKGRKFLKLKFSQKAHPCPIHNTIKITKAIYQDLCYEYEQSTNEVTRMLLLQRIHFCKLKLERYKEHTEKFKYQRPAQQEMERKLKDNPGVCEVQEDFCADYEIDGFKMINLIITLIYWDPKTKKLEHKFLDHYSRGAVDPAFINDDSKRGSANRFLQKAVWVRVLKENKEFFKQFHTFVKSNDNGSSIKNSATFYFAGRVYEEYAIRTIFFFLCPYHSCNRCDQHGGTTKSIIKAKQRKLNSALDTAEDHAAAINERKIPNTGQALAVDAIEAYDDDLPAGLLTKDNLPYQVYSLQKICMAYFETPDICDNDRDATTTIVWTGIGIVLPHAKSEDCAFFDTRPDAIAETKACRMCSKKFGRVVLLREHDQSKHYLCPVTRTYTIESKESLQNICPHCQYPKWKQHQPGRNHHICPSLTSSWFMENEGYHKSVIIRTFDGIPKKLNIIYSKPPFRLDLGPLKMVVPPAITARDVSRLLIPGMLTIYRKTLVEIGLPWGLGICKGIDFDQKCYHLGAYTMKPLKLRNRLLQHLSPLGKWVPSGSTVTVEWKSPLLYPIDLAYQQIPLDDLYKMIAKKDFHWNNIAALFATEIAKMEQEN